jgi:hypothetical protein
MLKKLRGVMMCLISNFRKILFKKFSKVKKIIILKKIHQEDAGMVFQKMEWLPNPLFWAFFFFFPSLGIIGKGKNKIKLEHVFFSLGKP